VGHNVLALATLISCTRFDDLQCSHGKLQLVVNQTSAEKIMFYLGQGSIIAGETTLCDVTQKILYTLMITIIPIVFKAQAL